MADPVSLSWTFRDVLTAGSLLLGLTGLSVALIDRRRKWWREIEDLWQARYETTVDRLVAIEKAALIVAMIQERHEPMEMRLAATEQAAALLKQQMEVFWRGVAYNAAQTLHSPHTPQFDALLDQLKTGYISPQDAEVLKGELQAILTDHTASRSRKAAARSALLAMHMLQQVKAQMGQLRLTDLFGPDQENSPPME